MHERVESCIEIRCGPVAAKGYHRLSGPYAVGHCCVRLHRVISMHERVESCIEIRSRLVAAKGYPRLSSLWAGAVAERRQTGKSQCTKWPNRASRIARDKRYPCPKGLEPEVPSAVRNLDAREELIVHRDSQRACRSQRLPPAQQLVGGGGCGKRLTRKISMHEKVVSCIEIRNQLVAANGYSV